MSRLAHSQDCDGYRAIHESFVGPVGMRMWRAVCQNCDWRGSLVGRGAIELARREMREHYTEVECAGGCLGQPTP